MMKTLLHVSLVLLLYFTSQAVAWDETFNFFECYDIDPRDRMPNTMENLIGIVERYEARYGRTNMDELAEMIINRYRKDGIVYNPNNAPHEWGISDTQESDKYDVVNKVLNPSREFGVDSFEPREECGLHMLVSHSIDLYPHKGVDDIWDGTINRRMKNDRNKRSAIAGSSGSKSSKTSSSSSSSSSKSSSSSSSSSSKSGYSSSSGTLKRTARELAPKTAARSSILPADVDPAIHPVESGVMETPYGPVAAGTLLAGLSVLSSNSKVSVGAVVGDDDSKYMPNEMRNQGIQKVYAASLSGDISQLAVLSGVTADTNKNTEVGPSGRYNNCTTCARLFSLQNNDISELTRAEVFAGLDVLILHAAYHDSSNSGSFGDSMSLSQLLRHYYSERGLPSNPDIKACNRLKLFDNLNEEDIINQALYFTYAYQDNFPTLKNEVSLNKNSYEDIESYFMEMVKNAYDALESFIKSYNYDDEGYGGCLFGPNTLGSRLMSSQFDYPKADGMTDLIAIYAEEGSTDYLIEQRQMIADVARRLGVGTDRSRIGVMSGRNGAWIYEMGNFSNIGDWACNFTDGRDIPSTGGSRADMLAVLESLSYYFHRLYSKSLDDMDLSSGNSQVVLWQVPSSFPSDVSTFNRSLTEFRRSYPDAYIIFMGTQEQPYAQYKEYSDDFLSVSNKNYDEILMNTVYRIKISPRYFIYPACDPDNSTMAKQYREDAHVYEGYVYPNHTTFLTIQPRNFIFSEELTIRVNGDVRTCFSRSNRLAMEDYSVETLNIYRDNSDETIVCIGGPDDDNDEDEVTIKYLCDRYEYECQPLHLSVTGLGSSTSRSSCTNAQEGCEFLNQIGYQVYHTGMKCCASSFVPSLMLLLLPVVLQRLLR